MMGRVQRRRITATALFLLSWFFLLAPHLPQYRARAAEKTALFLNPGTGTFLVGSTFDMSVLLDTKGTAVNTVEVDLLFPSDKLQITSPSVGRSLIQLWPAPPVFSNKEGHVYFAGGIPSGVVVSQGVVLTLTFRVTAPGDAMIRFGEKTSVLAHDGKGTDVLGQHPPAFYTFQMPAPQGPVISSPTHPDQEKWYRDSNPVFVWPKSRFADGYSYSIDRNPSGFPDTISAGVNSSVSFQGIENGAWYFHLRERAGGVWGGVSHYLVNIDNDAPASFRVAVSPSPRTTNRNPVLRFFTTDALSGFSRYEFKVIPLSGGEESEALFFEASSPYQMIDLQEGRYQVIVRAVDRAGNARDEGVMLTIVGSFTRFFSPEGIDPGTGFIISWARILLFLSAALLICILSLIILWRRTGRENGRRLRHTLAEATRHLLRKRWEKSVSKSLFLLILGAVLLGVSRVSYGA